MSRIGKNPVTLPTGVTVDVQGRTVKAKGKLGELSMTMHPEVGASVEGGKVTVKPLSQSSTAKSVWATTRTLISNMVKGVSEGYTKKMEIQGVGFRAQVQGSELVMQLGFSHDVRYKVPEGIKIAVEKQTQLTVTGIDKEKVGQVSAEIYNFRPPEPYKGKGIRFEGQYVRRKEGKKK
jgi:large subunit ribosomal protein L6